MAKRKRGYIPTEEELKKTYGGAGRYRPSKKGRPAKAKAKSKRGYKYGGMYFKTGPALRQIRTGSPESKKAPRKRRKK